MATFLITFVPHFEPEIQTFSCTGFTSRPTRLLAAALKEWMFHHDNAPDEIIAIGVPKSKWELLSDLVLQAPKDLDRLESKIQDSAEDLEDYLILVSQSCGVQIHAHVHEPGDDDSAMFERAFSHLLPLDEIVVDTTHGPVGLWMAFGLLEKESHLHDVVFQGFYGGRLGSTDPTFSKVRAPESTRGHLALLDLTVRLQTQPLRNFARHFQDFADLKEQLDKFDEAVRCASPSLFEATLESLRHAFKHLEGSQEFGAQLLGRKGQSMMVALAKSPWDFHVLNAMWKRNDALLFSRWAILCLTHLALIHHPNLSRLPELFEKTRRFLANKDTTISEWLYANASPVVSSDMANATAIIDQFREQPNPQISDNDLAWMTSFIIRYPMAFHRLRRELAPIRRGWGTPLKDVFDNGEYLNEAEVLQMMTDVCEAQITIHERGLCFGSVAPEQIYRHYDPKTKTTRYSPRWFATRQQTLHLARMSPYMSPEEVRGFGLTPASDIASLGLVALSCLQKSPVFGHEEPFELLEQIRLWKIPDFSSVPMSPALRSILLKCLKKDPCARFASAGTLLAILQLL